MLRREFLSNSYNYHQKKKKTKIFLFLPAQVLSFVSLYISTMIPIEWTASAAIKRLSWSCTINLRKTRAAIPNTTPKKALTLDGCRRTHEVTAWIGLCCGLIGEKDWFFPEKDGKWERINEREYVSGFYLLVCGSLQI